MAWRAASKRESERRRQQDAKSQDCNCDWIVGRNSKHFGHLWPRPSATIPMFGTRGPQDAQVGLLDPLAFDSVAHANWSGTEAFAEHAARCARSARAPVSEWIAAQVALVRAQTSAPAQAGSCGALGCEPINLQGRSAGQSPLC